MTFCCQTTSSSRTTTASNECTAEKAANLIVSFLQEVHVAVEYFDKELQLNGFVHTLCGNAHSFLETISCMLAIPQLHTHTHTYSHVHGHYVGIMQYKNMNDS